MRYLLDLIVLSYIEAVFPQTFTKSKKINMTVT